MNVLLEVHCTKHSIKKTKTVSVLIPTYNSSKTLKECIKSVMEQDHRPLEVIIVDSNSSDSTLKIAKRLGCRIITTEWKLLGARYLGAKASEGDYVLMLDSDQVLKRRNIISEALSMSRRYDMLVLEEASYRTKTLLEKMADADRKLVHNAVETQLDPIEGILLPRFFKKQVLLKAFKHIDMPKLHDVIIFDHVLIYYEAHKVSSKVSMIKDAVVHSEPSDLIGILTHNYRYGISVKNLLQYKKYNKLLAKKTRFRRVEVTRRNIGLIIQSYTLLILKGVAYELGRLIG